MNRRWTPSPLEAKCLQHLDAPGSWEALRSATPDDSDVLSWRPFRRVFGFNFFLFLVVLLGLFFGLEKVMSTDPSDLQNDWPYGVGFSFGLAVLLGAYVTHLYRQSWNKRARQIQRLESAVL